MRSGLFLLFGILVAVLIIIGVIYNQSARFPNQINPADQSNSLTQTTEPNTMQTPMTPSSESSSPVSSKVPDLKVDSSGLSQATVLMNTSQGMIKIKFYPNDAPKTVHRMIELV